MLWHTALREHWRPILLRLADLTYALVRHLGHWGFQVWLCGRMNCFTLPPHYGFCYSWGFLSLFAAMPREFQAVSRSFSQSLTFSSDLYQKLLWVVIRWFLFWVLFSNHEKITISAIYHCSEHPLSCSWEWYLRVHNNPTNKFLLQK